MSGHSHWSSIRFKKGATDAKKGKVFSKLSKMISIAARAGTDPETNSKLRLAIEKAKAVNLPKTNIERAIKKGAGGDKEKLSQIDIEAYGPGGVGLIIETITDNKNRTLAEIKHILSRFGGKIGSSKWMFETKERPSYTIPVDAKTKEQLEKLFEALDEQKDIQEIYSNLGN